MHVWHLCVLFVCYIFCGYVWWFGLLYIFVSGETEHKTWFIYSLNKREINCVFCRKNIWEVHFNFYSWLERINTWSSCPDQKKLYRCSVTVTLMLIMKEMWGGWIKYSWDRVSSSQHIWRMMLELSPCARSPVSSVSDICSSPQTTSPLNIYSTQFMKVVCFSFNHQTFHSSLTYRN